MDALVVGVEKTVFWQSVLLFLLAQVSKYTLNLELIYHTVASLQLGIFVDVGPSQRRR